MVGKRGAIFFHLIDSYYFGRTAVLLYGLSLLPNFREGKKIPNFKV
jgi:hypothetical protein